MNQLLNVEDLAIPNENGKYTATEIAEQRDTWAKVLKKIHINSNDLLYFLDKIFKKPDINVVLTGAGSSAYIGDVVSGGWSKNLSTPVRAVPTTDLVTHFDEYIVAENPLLLVSFARSGNSPESKAAIDIANNKCSEVYHLIITCNSKGELAKLNGRKNTLVFLLPPEAEDHSLAMTNSFTSMALAATLIPKLLLEKGNIDKQLETLSIYGDRIINNYAETLLEIARIDFKRIVFLGSGPLWGIAKESHLKVQELTNGDIIGKFDSFLGFRHGPKAIINDQTLLVYLLSNDKQTNRYEKDLIEQIAQHDINLKTLGIAEAACPSPNIDYCIQLAEESALEEEFWAILCTLPAQIIGFYKSLLLGYNPDNPSLDGTISRVVEGVTIYDDNTKAQNTSSE